MNDLNTKNHAPRLREAPAKRFSGPQHAFDLLQMSAHLLNEEHASVSGHRQMTIFRHDATSIVLFAFEGGGKMADHRANGLVTIHVIDGALVVEALNRTVEGEDSGWQKYELNADHILVLSPGVLHNVTANQTSRMLLTVHLESTNAPHEANKPDLPTRSL